jgi:hypothetical protein
MMSYENQNSNDNVSSQNSSKPISQVADTALFYQVFELNSSNHVQFSAEVDVLYAKVSDTDSGLLQTLCDQLVDKFVSAGIMTRQHDRVKMHVTLINTLFRRDDAGIGDNESGKGNTSSSALDKDSKVVGVASRRFNQPKYLERSKCMKN